MPSALEVTDSMNLPLRAREMLQYGRHPQERTLLFHEIFNAPIRKKNSSDEVFSHMDDQRVAFRASFILSEAFELLEKGLGLNVSISLSSDNGEADVHMARGSDNAQLTTAVLNAMTDRGQSGRNLVEVVDALGDLNVVVNGFALELGVDMRDIDREILASNLTKLDSSGQPIVANGSDPRYPAGKILKSSNYVEPNIADLLGLD